MSSPSPGKRRMDTDVVKLIESKHEVTILGGLNEFVVMFYGPPDTAYEGLSGGKGFASGPNLREMKSGE